MNDISHHEAFLEVLTLLLFSSVACFVFLTATGKNEGGERIVRIVKWFLFWFGFFWTSFTSMVFIWTTNRKQKWELTCSSQWIVWPFRAGGSLSYRPVLSQIYKCPKLGVLSKPLINSGPAVEKHHLCSCMFLQWSSSMMPKSLLYRAKGDRLVVELALQMLPLAGCY